jgi:hypothetical protein
VWSTAPNPGTAQRELQSAYTERLATLVLRPGGTARAEAQHLVRGQARALLARIATAQQQRGSTRATQQHLADNALTLRTALAAPLVRTAK